MQFASFRPVSANSMTLIRRVTANTWGMLEDWAGISSATLDGEKINDLSNLILMSTEVHEDFGSFRFWFEPTDQPYNYNLHLQKRQIRFGWASSVAFSDRSDRGLPLPEPRFLEIHAAFEGILLTICGGMQMSLGY
ncbi:hypothetical protein M407DRAFT_4301 [Tulasnella calospora MUT 4182]|uniref:HNH nuclease domain-containing protein n=1 Tax=Tulasnella calospora MUT 4182 TaxID=1051891 RepID=A0A0C3MGI5_9AGAM|nr:hypothetical protein M407DRAFT_4301 [Tulasnella calospora MUT 4182]